MASEMEAEQPPSNETMVGEVVVKEENSVKVKMEAHQDSKNGEIYDTSVSQEPGKIVAVKPEVVKTEDVKEEDVKEEDVKAEMVKTEGESADGDSKKTEKVKEEPIPPLDENLYKEFMSEVSHAAKEGEVERILSAFKLNAYEFLNLRFDANAEQIKKQYRKISLMIHPDKNPHPRAREAFQVLGEANKELMDDSKRELLQQALNKVKDKLVQEYKQEIKNDTAILLKYGGYSQAVKAYTDTDMFHIKWKGEARNFLADVGWNQRRHKIRMKQERDRQRSKEEEEKMKEDFREKEDKAWESVRDSRVNSWRNFTSPSGGVKKKQKKAGGISTGMLLPPKMKQEDSERSYVQRPVKRS